MSNQPTQAGIEGLLQDMGEVCTGTGIELGNCELFITEENASDWYSFHHDLGGLYDRLQSLIGRSKKPDPIPAEYIPIYGVTNGRGRIIA